MSQTDVLYSPFDALGLDSQEAQFDPGKLTAAYRLAALCSHEDSRRRAGVPVTQWPTFKDVGSAREYLQDAHGKAWEKFGQYPRTFYPHKRASQVSYEIPKAPFTLCDSCKMPLHEEDMSKHLIRSHEHQPCELCGSLFPVSDLAHHVESFHGLTQCELCKIRVPRKEADRHAHVAHSCLVCHTRNIPCLRRHTAVEHGVVVDSGVPSEGIQQFLSGRTWWKCPVCSCHMSSTTTIRRKHLFHTHSWEDCGSCVIDADDFDAHLEQHVWVQCPYGSCGRRNATTFMKHVERFHFVRPCELCEWRAEDAEAQAEHLRNHHPSQQCRGCRAHVDQNSLAYHLRATHGFVKCGRCGLFLPPDEYDEHYDVGHTRLESCGECGEDLAFAYVNEHLCKRHNYLRCPITSCDDVVATEALLKKHFSESHTDFISCGGCDDLQTPTGLQYHRREVHGYRGCFYCDVDLSPEDFGAHVDNHHPKVGCPECGEDQLEARLDNHLVEGHRYLQCPICQVAQSSVRFLAHLQEHPIPREDKPEVTIPVTTEATETCAGQGAQEGSPLGRNKKSFFRCPQCPAKYKTQTRLRHHMVSSHSVPLDPGEKACDDCGRPFSSSKSLRTHRSACHRRSTAQCREVKIDCGLCQKPISRSNLSTHEKNCVESTARRRGRATK